MAWHTACCFLRVAHDRCLHWPHLMTMCCHAAATAFVATFSVRRVMRCAEHIDFDTNWKVSRGRSVILEDYKDEIASSKHKPARTLVQKQKWLPLGQRTSEDAHQTTYAASTLRMLKGMLISMGSKRSELVKVSSSRSDAQHCQQCMACNPVAINNMRWTVEAPACLLCLLPGRALSASVASYLGRRGKAAVYVLHNMCTPMLEMLTCICGPADSGEHRSYANQGHLRDGSQFAACR